LIVLDTHTWVWWLADPDKISRAAREEIDRAMEREEILISSISCWEIALLVRKRRLELTMPVEDWMARSEALPFVQFVPLDNRIALRSNHLPGGAAPTL
jgi:PIN domain nuclease of toxin-antitoxin system